MIYHIRRLRGRSRAMKLSTNALIDLTEQRSSFRTSTRAFSFSSRISCFALLAASMFLAAMMTWALRSAKIFAVSNPIPLAPPAFHIQDQQSFNIFAQIFHLKTMYHIHPYIHKSNFMFN